MALVRSFRSFALTSTTHSVRIGKNTIKNHLIHNPTKNEIPKFECLLLRMSVANSFPFQWVDYPTTLEFFEFLNPFLILPNRKALSNHILNKETECLNVLRDEN